MMRLVARALSPRAVSSQPGFVPGQTLLAADLNDFATQSVVVGTPASGNMGAGTVNATAIYVNGVPVGSGGGGGGSIWDGGATVWD